MVLKLCLMVITVLVQIDSSNNPPIQTQQSKPKHHLTTLQYSSQSHKTENVEMTTGFLCIYPRWFERKPFVYLSPSERPVRDEGNDHSAGGRCFFAFDFWFLTFFKTAFPKKKTTNDHHRRHVTQYRHTYFCVSFFVYEVNHESDKMQVTINRSKWSIMKFWEKREYIRWFDLRGIGPVGDELNQRERTREDRLFEFAFPGIPA